MWTSFFVTHLRGYIYLLDILSLANELRIQARPSLLLASSNFSKTGKSTVTKTAPDHRLSITSINTHKPTKEILQRSSCQFITKLHSKTISLLTTFTKRF